MTMKKGNKLLARNFDKHRRFRVELVRVGAVEGSVDIIYRDSCHPREPHVFRVHKDDVDILIEAMTKLMGPER